MFAGCQSCFVSMAHALLITDLRTDPEVWTHLPTHSELGVTERHTLGDTCSSYWEWILHESLGFLTWGVLFLLPRLNLLTPLSTKETFISLPLYSGRYFQRLTGKHPKSFKWLKILLQDDSMATYEPLFSSIHQPAVLNILLGLGGGLLPGLSLSLLALLSMGPAPRFCIFLNPVHASETSSNAAHPSATYTSPLGTASNPWLHFCHTWWDSNTPHN